MAKIALLKKVPPKPPKREDEYDEETTDHGTAHCPESGCAIKLVAAEDED